MPKALSYCPLELQTLNKDDKSRLVLKTFIKRNKQQYLLLAKIAYNLLLILVISFKCKRAFSRARRIVTEEFYSLKTDVIKAK